MQGDDNPEDGLALHRLKSWTAKAVEWLNDLRQHENQMAMVLSLVIGAIVGLVVVAFILLTGRLAAHLYPADGLAWRRVLVPVLGALITGFLLVRYFPEARGSGIPQTKAALYIRDGRITLHTVIGKFLCCSTSLASGIALGREGPSVQIGAGIASVLGRRLGLSRDQVKALIPVGGAAALAAAFNTPIAAVLFSLEEIVGDLHASVLGSVVLSSATAWIVLHLRARRRTAFPRDCVQPGQLWRVRRLRRTWRRGRPGIGSVHAPAAPAAPLVPGAVPPTLAGCNPSWAGSRSAPWATSFRTSSASATRRSRRSSAG